MRRLIKIGFPLIGFFPACVIVLKSADFLAESFFFRLSLGALFPAFALGALAQSFFGKAWLLPVAIVSGVAWSCFMAYAFHKLADVITAGDFDWGGFGSGTILGAIPGAIVGWRLWLSLYKSAGLVTCCVIGGLLGGIALGIYMGSRWRKFK